MATSRKLILGTAGHIDHGKTALVRALTGVDTDRLPQEKQRGITIDIGFARLVVDGCELGIVDVPGHERFIRNMLAGATGNDLVMLVVAADDSVMPQTREHLAILNLLDVPRGLIAITKCDLADETMLAVVELEIGELVRDTFLADAPIVRTSATTGAGLDALRAAIASTCARVATAESGRLFRMAVDRAFVPPGQGTVVTGSIARGTLRNGDQVDWMPAGRRVRVRSLETHGRAVEAVGRGQRAAVGLAGVHHRDIERGHELASPGLLKPTRLLTVRLRVSADSPWPVRHRRRVRLHLGTAERIATVSLWHGNELAPGATALAQLFLDEPVAAMGRQPFVLRSVSPLRTLGGGHVLQPLARRIARRHADRFDFVGDLDATDPARRLVAALRAAGADAPTDGDLCRDADLEPDEVGALVARLADEQRVIRLPIGHSRDARLHPQVLAELEERVLAALRDHHAKHPLQVGMTRHALFARMARAPDDPLTRAVVGRLAARGALRQEGEVLSDAGFAPKLSATQQSLYERLVATFLRAAFEPPAVAEVVVELGVTDHDLRPILDLAVARGQIRHLGATLYLHADHERALRRRIIEALNGSEGLTVSQVRQLLDTTRKYAVPFCEYLDRAGITRRRGDLRVAV